MNEALLIQQKLRGNVTDEALVSILAYAKKNNCFDYLNAIQLKSPIVGLILGLFCGMLGFDRFYAKSIGLGIFKMVFMICTIIMVAVTAAMATNANDPVFTSDIATAATITLIVGFLVVSMWIAIAICFIWQFIDFFLVWKRIKQVNSEQILTTLILTPSPLKETNENT